MTKTNTPSSETMDKKPWQTLELKVLDVPSATMTGTRRLDPLEGFFDYRPS